VSTTIESLTRGLPEEFNLYLNYCRGLKFEEKPDYNYCRKLFKDFMHRSNFENDFIYDWVLKKSGKQVGAGIQGIADNKPVVEQQPPPRQEERKDNAARQQQQFVNTATAGANNFKLLEDQKKAYPTQTNFYNSA